MTILFKSYVNYSIRQFSWFARLFRKKKKVQELFIINCSLGNQALKNLNTKLVKTKFCLVVFYIREGHYTMTTSFRHRGRITWRTNVGLVLLIYPLTCTVLEIKINSFFTLWLVSKIWNEDYCLWKDICSEDVQLITVYKPKPALWDTSNSW